MPEARTVTYPADTLKRVVNRLRDEFPHIDQEEAETLAFDLVIDVVNGTDRLRAIEARESTDQARLILADAANCRSSDAWGQVSKRAQAYLGATS